MKETMTYHTTIREIPATRVAALKHQGDYNQIAATFEQLAAIAAGMNLCGPSTRSFAIYYDDPLATPRYALRSCGEHLADAPIVEQYLNDARAVPPNDLKMEIWLPLV